MNQPQRDFLNEVGLGALLAFLWCLLVLAVLVIRPTPTMQILAAAAIAITLLFTLGVGLRWVYLGNLGVAGAKNKLKRNQLPRRKVR